MALTGDVTYAHDLRRWGFLISLLLATICILFLGVLYAITGLIFIIQPYVSDFIFYHPLSFTSRFVQMIGSYLHSGKPGDYLALYLT